MASKEVPFPVPVPEGIAQKGGVASVSTFLRGDGHWAAGGLALVANATAPYGLVSAAPGSPALMSGTTPFSSPTKIDLADSFGSADGTTSFDQTVPSTLPGFHCLEIKVAPCVLFVSVEINWHNADTGGWRSLVVDLLSDDPAQNNFVLKTASELPFDGSMIGTVNDYEIHTFPAVFVPAGGPWYLGLSAVSSINAHYDSAFISASVIAQ